MSPADRQYLMAIESFRKCNKDLLPAQLAQEFAKQQEIPSFDSLEEAFASISASWNKMIEAIDPWKELLNPEATVAKFRIFKATGGHILVRPVGITAFVGAMSTALSSLTIEHIQDAVTKFQHLNEAPWSGVLWNSATSKMTVSVHAEKLARRLWRYLLGLDEDKDKLTKDWRAIVDPGNTASDLHLPEPVKKTEV